MGAHLNKDGKFQSDKYPSTPAGKVPLSVEDKTAQDLLWTYAQRRRSVDAEFSADLELCLRNAGYEPPTVAVSNAAIASVTAMLANTSRERTEDEKTYDEIVLSAVIKDGHRQRPRTSSSRRLPGSPVDSDDRLYMVTTIAASARFGGTRTVIVCRSFDRAREVIETNEGDIFETTYHFAVIERLWADHLYGLGDEDPERYWYVWEGKHEDGGYVPCEQPKEFENRETIGSVG